MGNPDFNIEKNERIYLRELAKKQAEYATLNIMAERKKMWYDLNNGKTDARPPVIIETGPPAGFDRDFMPAGILKTNSKAALIIEDQILRNIRNHELINDDKVIPDTITINWFLDIDEFGVKVEQEMIKDSQGIETGFRFLHPLKNLDKDFLKLRPAECKVNKEKTFAWKDFLEDLLGDILKVEIQTGLGLFRPALLTRHAIELIDMQEFFSAMCYNPDEVHRLMIFLRDNALRILRWYEEKGLLRHNNGNQICFGSSYSFTSLLPSSSSENIIKLCDIWGYTNSQETVSISPEMYHEFCFPYYRSICETMGLLYYGCCEPIHPIWDDIWKLPHLKKISISRWCDQNFMGDALRGSGIIFSRKPDPKFIGLDEFLDENAWAEHIRETLAATRGVNVEFIVRDAYTVHGNLNKPRKAVDVARKVIDDFYES